MIERYSLGCAFNLSEIFLNFPWKKLSITCKECKKIIGDNHRSYLAIRMFKENLRLVIEDIIENNVTFWLPLVGDKKCNMHMHRVQGQVFQKLRQHGKWKDVDIINSNFSGYEIGFYMFGNRTPRYKTVYVSKKYKKRISELTNNKMSYGEGNIDTTIKDYYEKIYLLFPNVPKSDIHKILNFAWKSLYLHNSYGGDVHVSFTDFWCYFGSLKRTPMDHFYYYIKKLTVKLRVLYKRNKVPWDGYYYFAINEERYQEYLKQKSKKGRRRKYFNFGNIMLFLIKDECRINNTSAKYIFRIPYISNIGIRIYIPELITDKAELIETKNPITFKDILTSNFKYEFL